MPPLIIQHLRFLSILFYWLHPKVRVHGSTICVGCIHACWAELNTHRLICSTSPCACGAEQNPELWSETTWTTSSASVICKQFARRLRLPSSCFVCRLFEGQISGNHGFSNQNKCVLPKIIHEVEVFCSYPLEFWEYPSPNPPSWAASPYLGPANLRRHQFPEQPALRSTWVKPHVGLRFWPVWVWKRVSFPIYGTYGNLNGENIWEHQNIMINIWGLHNFQRGPFESSCWSNGQVTILDIRTSLTFKARRKSSREM